MHRPYTIDIRRYAPSDRAALESIHDEARKIELKYARLENAFLPFSVTAEKEHLFDYDGIFVAETDGAITAFLACTERELAWLYVSPRYMRKGIGRALVKYALRQFPKIDHIEVLKGNEPAKALYESFGFNVSEVAFGAMPGNESFEVSVYIMRKEDTAKAWRPS